MKNKTFKAFNHRQVLRLAIPMILTNISTPLLGLVDTAVLGHLDSEQYLAAVALGSLIFGFVFWGFGFLRMSTTGLTAQAFGKNDKQEINAVFLRAIFLAFIIACSLLIIQQSIATLSFYLLQSSSNVEYLALKYFEIRIWSSPATLISYVLMGWFLGRQNVRIPLFLTLVINICNICLDIWFVYYLKMQVVGVALASVIAEYTGLILGLIIALRVLGKTKINWKSLVDLKKFRSMLLINSHIFIRTWCLIFAFAFFTAQSAKISDLVLAVNTVLLNFQTFMAYALDGFAHAAEALVGKAKGAKNKTMLKHAVNSAALWATLVAAGFVYLYFNFGVLIIDSLTGLDNVRQLAYHYLPWLIIMPLISYACYLFDGVFVGAMMTRAMRNTMLFSLFLIFLPAWYYTQHLGNHGLWLSMSVFMIARSLSMTVVYVLVQIHLNKSE